MSEPIVLVTGAGGFIGTWLLRELQRRRLHAVALIGLTIAATARTDQPSQERRRFIDNSLLIASEYPCTWPSHPFPRFAIVHSRTIGPESAYNIDTLLIDGNTGTQLAVPPHSVARPELKREKSGPLGLAYTDKIEPWQFGGEACVVDVCDLLDQAPKGISPLVRPEHVLRFEKQHRQVRSKYAIVTVAPDARSSFIRR